MQCVLYGWWCSSVMCLLSLSGCCGLIGVVKCLGMCMLVLFVKCCSVVCVLVVWFCVSSQCGFFGNWCWMNSMYMVLRLLIVRMMCQLVMFVICSGFSYSVRKLMSGIVIYEVVQVYVVSCLCLFFGRILDRKLLVIGQIVLMLMFVRNWYVMSMLVFIENVLISENVLYYLSVSRNVLCWLIWLVRLLRYIVLMNMLMNVDVSNSLKLVFCWFSLYLCCNVELIVLMRKILYMLKNSLMLIIQMMNWCSVLIGRLFMKLLSVMWWLGRVVVLVLVFVEVVGGCVDLGLLVWLLRLRDWLFIVFFDY